MFKKGDVQSVHDLQIYLQEKASSSERLYHYTTYESLICILKNKSLRLSRMDLLNDRAEQKLGRSNKQNQNYIMSFTRDKEYVSMWAMYGRPSGIKIRLDFNQKLLVKAINNNFFLDPAKTQKINLYSSNTPEMFTKKDYLVSDIVYFDKKSKELRHNENGFKNITAENYVIDEMTGFVKYDVWEFERETRLRVKIHNGLYNQNQHVDNTPKYIFAGINDELIKDFHITFNPWLSNEMKEEIQKSINSLAGFKIKCDSSQHDGEITDL